MRISINNDTDYAVKCVILNGNSNMMTMTQDTLERYVISDKIIILHLIESNFSSKILEKRFVASNY